MRSNIVIDDELLIQVMQLTGLRTKRAAVDLELKALLKLKKQEAIRSYRGKLHWDGDLGGMLDTAIALKSAENFCTLKKKASPYVKQ